MGDIIKFPTKAAADWGSLARTLRELLLDAGADPEMCSVVVARMEEYYGMINRDIEFNILLTPPGVNESNVGRIREDIEKGVKDGLDQFQEIMHRVLIDRVLTEIRIYNLENTGK